MKKIKLLVVQYKPIYLDIDSNLKKFSRTLKKYAYLQPDLVIFPEYAVTGPLYGHYELAVSPENLIFKSISALAQKFQTYLIPGSFIRSLGNQKYNSSCLINTQGKILGYYNKQCLWSSEKKFLQKGATDGIFETDFGKIAIQICADLHSSAISNAYRSKKPDIIINLAMWAEEDIKACTKAVPTDLESTQVECLLKARAIENRCYAVFCNFANRLLIKTQTGRAFKETSVGQSMIVSPYGKIAAKAEDKKETVLFAELDLAKNHWAKHNY